MDEELWFTIDDPETGYIERVVIPVEPRALAELIDVGLEVFGQVVLELPQLDNYSGRVQLVVAPGSVRNDSNARMEMAVLRQKARDLAEGLDVAIEDRRLQIEVTYGIEDVREPKGTPTLMLLGFASLVGGIVLAGGAFFVGYTAPEGADPARLMGGFLPVGVITGGMFVAFGLQMLIFKELPNIRRSGF